MGGPARNGCEHHSPRPPWPCPGLFWRFICPTLIDRENYVFKSFSNLILCANQFFLTSIFHLCVHCSVVEDNLTPM